MEASASWFMLQTSLAVTALWVGILLGRARTRRTLLWLGFGGLLLIYWTFLKRHPAIAVNAIPLKILYYIEGTASVPAFMLIVGIAYARSRLPRQRRVSIMAMLLGGIYFIHGGIWMLQPTPRSSMAASIGPVVLQTEDFTCVPAACATALNTLDLGLTATESEMARLTHARPGSGATLIRAADALRRKLKDTAVDVHILEMDYESLCTLDPPILTPLQLELSSLHMVVLLAANDLGVVLADPMRGPIEVDRSEFEKFYTGQIIAFER